MYTPVPVADDVSQPTTSRPAAYLPSAGARAATLSSGHVPTLHGSPFHNSPHRSPQTRYQATPFVPFAPFSPSSTLSPSASPRTAAAHSPPPRLAGLGSAPLAMASSSPPRDSPPPAMPPSPPLDGAFADGEDEVVALVERERLRRLLARSPIPTTPPRRVAAAAAAGHSPPKSPDVHQQPAPRPEANAVRHSAQVLFVRAGKAPVRVTIGSGIRMRDVPRQMLRQLFQHGVDVGSLAADELVVHRPFTPSMQGANPSPVVQPGEELVVTPPFASMPTVRDLPYSDDVAQSVNVGSPTPAVSSPPKKVSPQVAVASPIPIGRPPRSPVSSPRRAHVGRSAAAESASPHSDSSASASSTAFLIDDDDMAPLSVQHAAGRSPHGAPADDDDDGSASDASEDAPSEVSDQLATLQ